MWNRLFQIRSSSSFKDVLFYWAIVSAGWEYEGSKNRLLNIMLQSVVFHLLLDGWKNINKLRRGPLRNLKESVNNWFHHLVHDVNVYHNFNTWINNSA